MLSREGIYFVDDGEGAPVVLLHGQPGLGQEWSRINSALVDSCRVLTLDRPGYGQTLLPPTGFMGNAEAVVRLLDELNLEKATFVSTSWAGGVLMALGSKFADRCDGLVFLSSPSPLEPLDWSDRLSLTPGLGRVVTYAGFKIVPLLGRSAQARAWMGLTFREIRADEQADLIKVWRGPRPRAAYLVEADAMRHELPGYVDVLPSLTMPTAVVVGERDRLVPAEIGRRLAATMPSAQLHSLDFAGHSIFLDGAHEVADIVLEMHRTIA